MQTENGSMRMLNETKPEDVAMFDNPKTLKAGTYFKVKKCYFKIDYFNEDGFFAKGVTRREYFDNR